MEFNTGFLNRLCADIRRQAGLFEGSYGQLVAAFVFRIAGVTLDPDKFYLVKFAKFQ
jgi:hypothetical protein